VAYTVYIGDNFHFQDESERVTHGTLPGAEEALAACCSIVDEFLADALKPGMTAEALWEQFTLFGDDPWVQTNSAPALVFDAWEYARKRCEEMGRGKIISRS
jgi:hypothetical protein